MTFVIFRARSCERLQHHFWANFWVGTRCCFMLCITMAVEPRSAKQYKCHLCCSCKNYWGWRVGGKCLCVVFWLIRRSRVCGIGGGGGGASYSTSNNLLLVARHILTTPLQKCLSNWLCKIHCHRLPLWRKYAPEVKAAKGLKRCRAKVKGVNNPSWTAQ